MTDRSEFPTVNAALGAATTLSALVDAADLLLNEIGGRSRELNALHALLPLLAREAEALRDMLDAIDTRQRKAEREAADA